MPFPPTPTNVWDVTQPPDTQAANLLGQDIRNLKTDIMQRLSLLSGTTANLPTPETINAVWGGSGYGLLYFATDTGFIWQWNGSSWVNVISKFTGSYFYGGVVLAPADTNEDTLYSFTLPANSNGFSFDLFMLMQGAGAVVRMRLGVGTGFAILNSGNVGDYRFNGFVSTNDAISQHLNMSVFSAGGVSTSAQTLGLSFNNAIDNTISITQQQVNGSDGNGPYAFHADPI